ncbi:MAG: ImmA/IrrE family metallo-endopeptidase [Clostridia bacterium]|nr:ImmA/IrrE family metallo-endopeptidase [Clostridia bacterium]
MTENVLLTAKHLKTKYGTGDPKELCELLGISVIFTDLPDAVDGFYFENDGRRAVIINRTLGATRALFCIAHELGHALLHKDMNSYFISENTNMPLGRYEREADLFAAELLFGDEYTPLLDIEHLSAVTGLSRQVIDSYFKLRTSA